MRSRLRPIVPWFLVLNRHMCVQLRGSSHARLLKDYFFYVPRLIALQLPNTLLLVLRGGRVHGRRATCIS